MGGIKCCTLRAGRRDGRMAEVIGLSEASRLAALAQAGLVHPRAEAVTAPLFSSGGFFLAGDRKSVV